MEGQKHIIVIGAGAGGTATAARLAREGFKVTVVEKNSFGGGRCSLIYRDGHRFDQGPSLYLMPKLFQETFEALDENIEDHVELLRCHNNYKVHFDDGDKIHLSSDLSRMKTEMERVEGPDGFFRFLEFMKEAHIHYEKGVDLAIKKNFEDIWKLIKIRYIPEIFRLHLLSMVYTRASAYFKTKKMRMAFTFQSMYMGMSPYDSPAVYNLLQYTEFAEGIWYPKGGFNVVIQRLQSIAEEKFGARFIFDASVDKINTHDETKQVTGITLQSGEVIEADAVVCNADLVYAYHNFLPPCKWTTNILAEKKLTSSSISFYWSFKKIIPELDVHNIFLAEAYRESFDEIFHDLTMPSELSFYVNVPSRIDSTAAPPGKDSIIVLVPIGHMKKGDGVDKDYTAIVKKARKMVIEVLERRLGLKNLVDEIEHEEVNDPSVWQKKFNLWRGSILGLSHDIFQVLWFRPSTKDSTGRYDNLFFVGASTHPGTGVPIVLAGSKLTSKQVCDHFGVKVRPSTTAVTQRIYLPEENYPILWDFIKFSGFILFLALFGFFFTSYYLEESQTAASYINAFLPDRFRVPFNNVSETILS